MSLPRIDANETQIDVSLLDVMGIDDFLALLKTRTENNSKELWKETSTLAHQLKASRELLSIGSSLVSNQASKKMLDRLVASAVTILGAERIYLFEKESTSDELVVKYSSDRSAIGVRVPISSGIEGDVVSKKICANVPDVAQDPRFIPALDTKLGAKTRCMVCAPIMVRDEVVGVIQASNKVSMNSPRSGRDFSSLSFTSNEALLLSFIAMNVGLALQQASAAAAGEADIDAAARRERAGSSSPTSSIAAPATNNGHNSSSSSAVTPRVPAAPIETYRGGFDGGGGGPVRRLFSSSSDSGIKILIDNAYNKLDAERVSIFTYSAANKSLVCTASQDIEGFTIPTDKGFVGFSFTANRIVNVPDAKADARHFDDVDSKVGYTTRNLLCAPIVNQEGHALGVVQAVNKKSGPSFTTKDEQQIIDVCKRLVVILKEKAAVIEHIVAEDGAATAAAVVKASASSASAPHTAGAQGGGGGGGGGDKEGILARCCSNMMMCKTLPELTAEAEVCVKLLTNCDYAGIFVVDHDGQLLAISPTGSSSGDGGGTTIRNSNVGGGGSGAHRSNSEDASGVPENVIFPEIPPLIKESLQFASVVEFKLPPPTASGDPHYLLPGLPLQQALIIPLNAKAYPYTHGSCVLIAGHTVSSESLGEHVRSTLETIADYVATSLHTISQRLEQDDKVKLMKAQFNLANNALGALRDFVILLNEEGNFIGSNKIVEELLGAPSNEMVSPTAVTATPPSADAAEDSPGKAVAASGSSVSSNGTQIPLPPSTAIVEGTHYTEWLTNGNSPELCRDITLALQQKKVRSLDKVKFFSVVHPDGILIDYQIVPIENAEVRNDRDIPTPRLMLSKPQSESSMPADDEEVTGLTNCAVVVVIHTENFHHRKTLGPAASYSKLSAMSFSAVDVDSAHGVVDAATSIVNNVRSSFRLEDDVEEALKHITKSLNNASRKLSINGSNQSSISTALTSAILSLVSYEELIPPDIFDWEFNVLNFTDGMALCNLIGKFFVTLFDFTELSIDTSTLARYIIEVGKNYHDRPFHNLQHSACVTHFTYKLITETEAMEKLSKHQQFAILLSAVVHDVDHPGNTNLFEVNSASELALRYNDQAVLENHHCSTAFRLMRKQNLNILSTVPKPTATDIRKTIISCVMATDMAVHFDLIDETKKKAQDGGIDFEDPKDQAFLGKILLHSADLSNPVRPFNMTREWARRISLEFNDQVIREQALGMPVLGFMMTPDEKAFCKNETGFASFVVAPMWRAMSMLYPQLNFLVEQLESNVGVWKQSLEKLQEEEERAAVAATQADAST